MDLLVARPTGGSCRSARPGLTHSRVTRSRPQVVKLFRLLNDTSWAEERGFQLFILAAF